MTEKYFSLQNSKFVYYPGFVSLLNKILFLDECNHLYGTAPLTKGMPAILAHILNSLHIQVNYNHNGLKELPNKGPLIIVSNHPFGGLDGLVLAHVLLQVRPDLRILANFLLNFLRPLVPLFIPIDPMQIKAAKLKSYQGLKRASHYLAKENALLIFPSGTVSHWHFLHRKIQDPTWHNLAVKLAKTNHATIVPVFVHGHNSWYFQLAGIIHPFLRTLLLPQQFFAKKNQTVNITIGAAITQDKLKTLPTASIQTQFIRQQTYQLQINNQK